MVNVVNVALSVDKLNEIFDNLNDVFARQHLHLHRGGQVQLLVDAVTAYLAKVITLLREEKVGDDLACRCVVRRLGVAQLSVDVLDSLFLSVRGVFLQSVENDGIIHRIHILLLQKHCLGAALQYVLYVFFSEYLTTIHNGLVAFDTYHLTRVRIREILLPCVQHTRRQLAIENLLDI